MIELLELLVLSFLCNKDYLLLPFCKENENSYVQYRDVL